MALIQLVFLSNQTSDMLIAGLPAVARAARNLADREIVRIGDEVRVVTLDETHLSLWSQTEIARLAPALPIRFGQTEQQSPDQTIDGDRLAIGAYAVLPLGTGGGSALVSEASVAQTRRAMQKAGQTILKATGKVSDGLVSRFVNRPISRFVSGYCLLLPGVTPAHGTMAALLIGVAMTGFLFFGGSSGIVIGGVLFQLASVIDGVDGEIARATFRSSQFGAKLDTLCDAATNLAFVGGLTFNLWQRGETLAGLHGLVGMGLLAVGLTLLAWRSLAEGKGFNFDLLKNEFRKRPSRLQNILASVTSRDVYALVFALLAVVGLAAQALMAFAWAVGVWLLVVVSAIARMSLASR